ncbi:MAG: thioredoxin peroxidase [Elusimicrobia bacterium RIFOXYD12_FULL_66_9]|nr:MAG: thioredoxin peroxidase [Elusimicrobia bacterium RIFOXYD12_FULL_66_9]
MADTLVQKDAPEFKAEALVGKGFKEISLSDYKGKWVALFFYPLDFTFVCPTEIVAFSERYEDFKKLGCEVLGCSVDSKFTHLAWTNTPRKEGGLGEIAYPILSDITKKIARDYGVLVNDAVALRGLFLISPKGKVAYSVVHDLGVGRSVDETLRVLEAFQQVEKTGEVCPANWNHGKKTMKPDTAKSKEYFASVA